MPRLFVRLIELLSQAFFPLFLGFLICLGLLLSLSLRLISLSGFLILFFAIFGRLGHFRIVSLNWCLLLLRRFFIRILLFGGRGSLLGRCHGVSIGVGSLLLLCTCVMRTLVHL